MSPEVAALIGTSIGLAGGFAITYWGSINLAKRQGRSQAAMRLIYAFKNEIAILSDLRNEGVAQGDIIESAFKKHLAAYIEFRFYLTNSKRACFDKAWNEYHCYDGDPKQPFLEQYSEHIGGESLAKENRELAISRMEKLLSFAEKKL